MLTDKPLTPLADAFHFTPDDLRANRENRLSGRQKFKQWRRFWGYFWGGVLLIFAPILITWGLVMWGTEQSLSDTVYDSRSLIGYVIAVILGLIYITANFSPLILCFDLLVGRVYSVRGTAEVWGRYLRVGGYRFVMEEGDLSMIQPGMHYRVFMLQLSQTLLSIEFAE
jgi:hypothetical protein